MEIKGTCYFVQEKDGYKIYVEEKEGEFLVPEDVFKEICTEYEVKVLWCNK